MVFSELTFSIFLFSFHVWLLDLSGFFSGSFQLCKQMFFSQLYTPKKFGRVYNYRLMLA